MKDYTQSITPDSFSGMIFALEGVKNNIVLLNGPTGCKFYHAAVSENLTMKPFEFDPLNYPAKWYFGQPRVPCTYLDRSDYVYGSKEKLTEILEFMKAKVSFDLLSVVNSPGAALIGDDLAGITKEIMGDLPVITMETPGFSKDICNGYEAAALTLLKRYKQEKKEKVEQNTVNLLGLSIFHRHHQGDMEELSRLLSLCGVNVNCVLCVESDLKQIENIPKAALNIVIHPEYGLRTARFLKESYDTPFYVCDGPPVGFAATEKMMGDVCAILGTDDSALITESEKARARVYLYLSRIYSLTGMPKGVHFAVEGTYAEIYAYTAFLMRHFGMIPDCAAAVNQKSDCYRKKLEELLSNIGLSHILERDILETDSEIVFASGGTIAKLKLKNHPFVGIETALPSLGYIDVIPKTHLGIKGALQLTEEVINALP